MTGAGAGTRERQGGKARDRERLLRRATELARDLLGMDMAYVADTRAGRQSYVAVAGAGASFGAHEGESFPLPGTICELVLRGEVEGAIPDTAAEPLVRELPVTRRASIGAYIGVPITLSDGRTYGTFCALAHEAREGLHDRDLAFMTVLAGLIATQIEEDEQQAMLQRLAAEEASVAGLLAALEARDGYTQEHSTAVVALALSVGRALGLVRAGLEDLRHVALLHDIGKIGIPDAILRKEGALTVAEWDQMRRHPEIGERIIGSMRPLAHLAPVVRAEHERWDGDGYPDGLAGEAIPLAARIVLVCDAFHAMTSDRPYRAALPRSEAILELEAGAGSQFCPRCVAAAVTTLRGA